MKKISLIVAFFAAALTTAAQTTLDKAAYCRYLTDQAAAQRDLLRAPSVVAEPFQPNTGTPPQLALGLEDSLSDMRKASLTMKAAKANCGLYNAAVEAEEHLLYALPGIEKDILRHRLDLIQTASDNLDALIAKNLKLVEAQNLTRSALYALQSAKVRLDTSRTATLTGIATPYVPPLSDVPIKDLIADKLKAEDSNLRAANKLEKQNSWDWKFSGGAYRSVYHSPYKAYGQFTFVYNLGRRAANHRLDESVSAYGDWKRLQFDDVTNQADILKRQITDTIEVEKSQLTILRSHDSEIAANLKGLEGIDTNNIVTFRNQLLADQTILRVEIMDVEYRISKLEGFVQSNF